jgi:glycosyltransferase involved in cell wall biosynthesis
MSSQAHLLDIIVTIIPKQFGWKRLDRESAWEHFSCDSLNESDQDRLKNAVSTARVVCPIDWTGSMAWQSIDNSQKPVLYLNFRVFGSGVATKEREWYNEKEKRALDQASFVVALSEKDKESLCELMTDKTKPVQILLPPLRGDVKELACLECTDWQAHLPSAVASSLTTHGRRCLVTCIARLSPEKHIENFLHFVSANRATLDDCGFITLLAGSTADEPYARRIKDELQRAAPHAIIIDSFLSPKALAAVFSRTSINFHPCEYDAFGMTIIEAAAFGVPSVVSANGAVGASAIVGNGASIEVNMNQGCEPMSSILCNPNGLTEIGEEARKRALSWDEEAYGKQLLEYIHAVELESS